MVLEAGKGLENSGTNARICNKVRALVNERACQSWQALSLLGSESGLQCSHAAYCSIHFVFASFICFLFSYMSTSARRKTDSISGSVSGL